MKLMTILMAALPFLLLADDREMSVDGRADGLNYGVTLDGGRVLVNANRFGVTERLFVDAVVPNDFALTTRRTAHCVLAKAVLAEAVEPRLQVDYAYGFGPDATVTVRVQEWQTVEGQVETPAGTRYFTSVFSTYPARYGLFDGAREAHPFTHEIRAKGCVGYFHENYYSKPGDTMQVRTGFSDRSVAEAAAFLAAEMPTFDEPAPKFICVPPEEGEPLPQRAFVTDNPTAANIQRTMKKLEESTAENPATVRILFYGQSITFQLWSARVVEDLKRRYPTVNFVVRNEAIGGYGTDSLLTCMETDVFPFYPDLLIFHDYGDARDGYLRILNEVRRRTTAEIALCSSHLRGDETATNIVAYLRGDREPAKWNSDAAAADRTRKIRSVAEDLGALYVDLQGKWCRTLMDNGWESKHLLRDGIHLNPLGIEYYAAFYADELVRRPELQPGAMSGRISEEPFATRLEFSGNRVAAVSDGTGDPDATAEVWLDGEKVGDVATPQMWGMTRSSALIGWFPGLRGNSFRALPVDEFWTLTILPDGPQDEERTSSYFYRRKTPLKMKPIRYRVEGSVTGFDGEGDSAHDFVSKSGRVTIPAYAFVDYFEWPKQRPKAGARIVWRTYPLFAETYRAQPRGTETVLVQGCANAKHVLELRNVKGKLGIGRFVVNEPTHRELPKTTLVVNVRPGEDLVSVRDSVRWHRHGDERAEVILEDGVHQISEQVTLDSPKDANTVWRAKNPGKAILVGGAAFRGADFKILTDDSVLRRLPQAARGKVRQLALTDELKEKFEKGRHAGGGQWTYHDWNNYRPNRGQKFDYPDFPCLTVGLKHRELARWPNGRDWCWIGSTNLVRQAKDGKNALVTTGTGRERGWDFTRQNIAAAGWISAWRYLNWCTEVTGLDAESGALTLAEARVNPEYARAFFFNIPEELDEPGEWCYDGKSGTVLLYPPAEFTDGTLCAIGSTTDILFHVTGNDISLQGLVFTAKVGHPTIVIEGDATGNEVRGCRFSGVGYDGIWMAGRHNAVRDCDFEDIVSMAVGVLGGDLKTMVPAGNLVDNNRVRHPEILCTTWAKSGIYVDGVGNRVSHNVVSDSVSSGIYFAGYDHVLEYNRVYDVNKEFDDVGVVYSPGGQRCYGNVFRYNDLSGLPGQGVALYYDDATSGHEAYGNVLRNAGSNSILIGGGRDNYIHDNLLIGGFTGIEMDNRGLTWPAYTTRDEAGNRAAFVARWDVTNRTSALVRKYPKLLDWYTNSVPIHSYAGNRFERNVIVDPSGYATAMVIGKGRTIDPKYTVFTNNVLIRTTGPKNGFDLVLHPENVATNEYSERIPCRPPVGPVRVIDGTPEKPIDLGFADLPETMFNPCLYFTYAAQNWVDRPKLYDLRREKFKSLDVKPWRKGNFTLKSDARLVKEVPGFKPIPWKKIGLYQNEWRTQTED